MYVSLLPLAMALYCQDLWNTFIDTKGIQTRCIEKPVYFYCIIKFLATGNMRLERLPYIIMKCSTPCNQI